MLPTETLFLACFVFVSETMVCMYGGDKFVCPMIRGHIPELHDWSQGSRVASRVPFVSFIFIRIFSDVKVQLCFSPWYLKTRVLKANTCKDVSYLRGEWVLASLQRIGPRARPVCAAEPPGINQPVSAPPLDKNSSLLRHSSLIKTSVRVCLRKS